MKQMSMKEARKRAGLTQMQLSDKVGIVYSTLSAIENGKFIPIDLTTYFRIETALDALGQIRWEVPPSEVLNIVLAAIKNLCAKNYPIDSVLVFVGRLFRNGHSALLFKLAGYDSEAIDQLDQEINRLMAEFTPEECDKIVKILSNRKKEGKTE